MLVVENLATGIITMNSSFSLISGFSDLPTAKHSASTVKESVKAKMLELLQMELPKNHFLLFSFHLFVSLFLHYVC